MSATLPKIQKWTHESMWVVVVCVCTWACGEGGGVGGYRKKQTEELDECTMYT